MDNQQKQAGFTQRGFTSRSSFQFLDKSLSNSFEDPLNPVLYKKQPSFGTKSNQGFSRAESLKAYTIFKTDPNLLPELLERYTQAMLYYREESYSQLADSFLTKISMDSKIPGEYRAKFPFLQILVALTKIFMLSDIEVTAFACLLDHCNWNVDDVLAKNDGGQLIEFPANLGLDVSNECKRFIIYMLIIGFSLKQYLGEKSEVDQCHAYCEHICHDFHNFYNKWIKAQSTFRFSYNVTEINRKFKILAKRDTEGRVTNIKDYNSMVDEIMGITGTYATKNNTQTANAVNTGSKTPPRASHGQAFETQPQTIAAPKPFETKRSIVFPELRSFPTMSEHKAFGGSSLINPAEKSFFRSDTIESFKDDFLTKLPSFMNTFHKQPSFSNFFSDNPLKRQGSMDVTEDQTKKKLKGEDTGPGLHNDKNVRVLQSQPSLNDEKHEDLMNINLPMLSKKTSSHMLQNHDEYPSFSRFQSMNFMNFKEE